MKKLFCVVVLEYDQECDGYGDIHPELYYVECDDEYRASLEVNKILEAEGYDLDNYSITANLIDPEKIIHIAS